MRRPYAEVIGDPIAHSKSPLIHNFWLAKLGIDAEYRACHVRPGELEEYFTRRRGDAEWRGCNVTIPHKVSVLSFADKTEIDASSVGASNCLVRHGEELVARNTDVDGVFATSAAEGMPICMIGAGGAAKAAICAADFWGGAYDMRVLVRDPDKAGRNLPTADYGLKLFSFADSAAAMADTECVINASPLGMIHSEPMPEVVLDSLCHANSDARVFDMVYAPLETEFLKRARAHGQAPIDGLVMLVGQAKSAFEHFFGVRPSDEHDAELRALLTT